MGTFVVVEEVFVEAAAAGFSTDVSVDFVGAVFFETHHVSYGFGTGLNAEMVVDVAYTVLLTVDCADVGREDVWVLGFELRDVGGVFAALDVFYYSVDFIKFLC